MSSKVEFTLKQMINHDSKWRNIELHEALDENCLTSYWNEMIEDFELIPTDDSTLLRSKKGLIIIFIFNIT